MDDFWAPPRCLTPVIINVREVRWCHLDKGHAAEQHETIHNGQTHHWPNERSTTP